MTDSRLAAYIEAITFLERRLGARTNYQILEPFSFDATDIVAVNKAARRIAEFIGLGEYTFVVALKSQAEGVGGNIELRHGEPGAFIEVAEGAVKFEDAVLATLSHELVHKFLHTRDISVTPELKSQLDDEILTDVTAIFLGLGKLMLQGCECEKVSTQENPQGKVTTTETYRCGYLDRSQLSLIYLVVCSMRRIPAHVYESGLRPEPLAKLRVGRRTNSPFLDSGWYERIEKSGGTTVPELLTKTISDLQERLAEVSRDLLFLQGSLGSIDAFLEQAHTKLYRSRRWLAGTDEAIEPDPCVRYLEAVRRAREVASLAEELAPFAAKARDYREALRKVSVFMDSMGPAFSAPPLEFYRVVTCKVDGTRLRLPENSPGLTAECPNPKCHYRFRAITAKPLFASERAPWKRLLKLFEPRH